MSTRYKRVGWKIDFGAVKFQWIHLPFASCVIFAGLFYIAAIYVQVLMDNLWFGLPLILAAWGILAQKTIPFCCYG